MTIHVVLHAGNSYVMYIWHPPGRLGGNPVREAPQSAQLCLSCLSSCAERILTVHLARVGTRSMPNGGGGVWMETRDPRRERKRKGKKKKKKRHTRGNGHGRKISKDGEMKKSHHVDMHSPESSDMALLDMARRPRVPPSQRIPVSIHRLAKPWARFRQFHT